jgi:ketosteroid isomerase-like protein
MPCQAGDIFCALARVLQNTFAFFKLKKGIMILKKGSLLFIAFLVIVASFFSCDLKTENINKRASADEILNADKAFSDMSRQLGMKKAFLEYIDDEGILLRPNHKPIVGADAIDFLSLVNDTAYTLTWKPSAAQIAKSGELGFSYGIYELKTKDTTLNGTYVSIWKKERNGSWKFILDSGNERIAPAE